jgi:hypothetical protein
MNVATAYRDRLLPRLTIRRALVLYGVALAVVAFAAGDAVWPASHVTLLGSRLQGLTTAIDVVDHGGPPLLGSSRPYAQSWQTTPEQSYFSAASTDDPGIYLYLPVAGRILGVDDPRLLLKWFVLASFALLACIYPLLFYELFGSLAVSVGSPVPPIAFLVLGNSDIYWIAAWCALACLPVLMLLAARRWGGRSVAACAGVAIIASFASSIRSETGLGVAIAAVALAVVRERSWRRRLAVGALVAAAYLTIRPALIKGVETYRDHAIASYIHAHPGWSSVSSSGHPFWHSAYIGLGYLPNRWGIVWKDASAAAAVRRVDPKAPYLSARYSSILEHRYFHILRTDPGFVLRTYAAKAAVEANSALRHFLPGLVLLPAVLLFGPRRRRLATWVLLVLPTLVIQFAPPVLVVPGIYGIGFLAAVGLLALLPVCELLALAERTVAARRRGEGAASERSTIRDLLLEPRAWVAVGAALLLLVAAVALHSKQLVLRPGSALDRSPAAHT